MQHLDGRLEHLDEFHQTLRRAVEAAREGVGVGIVLAVHLELADIDLADEAGDVLVVFVARLGLRDADLLQAGGLQPHDSKFRDVAAKFLEALDGPGRDRAGEAPLRHAVALFDLLAEGDGIEQAERALENRAYLLPGLEHVNRLFLHQLFQPLSERRFAAERLLKAIGDPIMVDTAQDPRLGRIFMNRTIKVYPAFADDFFGMEDTIERIVGFFRHAAQGLEERKQVLYLLGPVGGGKSSLAERLKQLMEKEPVYVLKAGKEISPVFESPLGLFDPVTFGEEIEKRYGVPKRRLTGTISPWAVKRLEEFGGDITKFTVVRLQPSRLKQICVAKTEPGDENNQDVASLVGKVDIRKLEMYSQNDPDAYSFSGGLNRTTQA